MLLYRTKKMEEAEEVEWNDIEWSWNIGGGFYFILFYFFLPTKRNDSQRELGLGSVVS